MVTLLCEERGNHPEFVFTYICQKTRRGPKPRVKGKRYPFSRNGWRKSWRAALEVAAITNFKLHDLRHTMATRTLRACRNLKVVQAALGYSDICTTSRCVHAATEDVRSAMEQAQSRNLHDTDQLRVANALKGKD